MDSPGNAIIAIRLRHGLFGCDSPSPGGWHDSCKEDPLEAGCKIEDSPFHDPTYWTGLGGAKTFPFIVRNNRVEATGYRAEEITWVRNNGTAPAYAATLGGNTQCIPSTEYPAEWYERSIAQVSGNQITVPYKDGMYQDEQKCDPNDPVAPLIEISNESYNVP